MTHNSNRKSRFMPGLDGLRALSVLAVIAYHLNVQGVPGGYLGVGVFFVLSGYLITDQLIARWRTDGAIDLKAFWIRRARRLLPAMLLTTAAVSMWLAILDPGRLANLGGDIGSAVTYVYNWWLIGHQVSYFESFGPPSPFGHFWSLAVEEQFYLLWPIVLLALLKLAPRRGRLAAWMLAGAAASALLMALLYSPDADPSRVYYGTDTRIFGLLIGAALAVVWPSGRLSETLPKGARAALDGLGVLALAAIGLMIVEMGEYDPFVYRGGLVLLSVLTAVLVAALAHPASRLARLLSARPLRWIGTRSYGLYLWHFPVIALTTPAAEAESFSPVRALLQAGASFLLAALSWKLIEEPILRGRPARRAAPDRSANAAAAPSNGIAAKPGVALLSTGLTLILCVSCGGGAGGTATGADARALAPADTAIGAGAAVPATLPASGADRAHAPGGGLAGATAGNGAAQPPAESAAAQPAPSHAAKPPATGISKPSAGTGAALPGGSGGRDAGGGSNAGGAEAGAGAAGGKAAGSAGGSGSETVSGKGVTAIGDSVLLGVKPYLEEELPGIVVDGKVGRQLAQAEDTVEALGKAGKLGDIVILELGTNGPFTKKKLTDLLDSLGNDRSILLVNTRVPKKWQDDVNKMLKEAASAYDNVALVDWYAASAGKDHYFGKDGVHPTKTGAKAYAAMLEKSVKKLRQDDAASPARQA